MANYENLPVFKASYDLLLRIYGLGQHWKRDIKFTLGEELKKEIISIQQLIYQANTVHAKSTYIEAARVSVVKVKLQLRILFDLKEISLKQYAGVSEQIESVSKQLASWAKSQREKEES